MRAKPNIKSITCGLFNYRLFFTLLLFIGGYTFASGSEALYDDYTQSETATVEFSSGTGTQDDPYLINTTEDFTNFVTNTSASSCYKLCVDVSASGITTIETTFSGTLEADIDPDTQMPYRITNLDAPLFTTLTGTVKNLVLEDVSISGNSGNTGAIACTAESAARIYNVGILSGEVGGTTNTGGLVGLLNGKARVVNCYSYANITGGTNVGGIVGNNNATTTAASINTMVMNCMFYGDIIGGTTVSPVYGGTNIANLQGGLNTFNYYAYDELKTKAISNNKYNSALAVEQKYLNRFEFYRLLLNSNKKLAAFYVTGNVADANQMLKWVLETADRTIDNPKPYPILKAQGKYPSIINPDFENAPDIATVGRNHGGKLSSTSGGTKTLSVTISGVGSNAPSGASITTGSLTLTCTDKDFDRFNFNYDKVQLPYYNDVGTGNYTGNRVVTGWKITAITAIAGDPYTSANYPTTGITDYPNHNYADRKSSNKDLYSVSKRVFSQGAYFDVPYGVTSITIEPYWGKAYYLADQYYDVVYTANYKTKQGVSQTGTQVNTSTTKFNGQNVETSIEEALKSINDNMGGLGATVYDNALVLVGNLHLNTVPQNGTNSFTMMSVDEDNDHEPDYSLIYHHTGRTSIAPIRFDFLNIPGTAQAQKPNGASLICNFTIFKTRGWFETTNTALFYTSQLEYENLDGNTKADAPLILLGGVVDQFVSTQSKAVTGKTIYIHVGGNVWIQEFGMGTHSDGSQSTPHVPVSVTGGEFPGFYLTGTYNANATIREDNAECYISGGYFHEVAGASQEGIKGNVRWQIYNADIDQFFGGGINEAKPIQGTITTDIYNSYVTLFCGGPKFGNMTTGKAVTTNAEGCTFGNYFGAGYGGNSYSRKKYYDNSGNQNWTTLQNYYVNDKGEYYNGTSTGSSQTSGKDYGKKGPGVATDFDYEFFVWSSGTTGARLFVKFVSFSLAQCDNVSSTLKKCTINENFYGGGSLGKVSGTATSELEDCTVMGNAFGAGYSATLPTIPVRDGGFTTNPNYNQNSGMFEPGIYTGTTEYTWKQVASYPTEGGAGFDGTQVITTQNLDKTNLGSVGNVQLTIKGTTTVAGSVYGGGEESAVGGAIEVNILNGTIATDVFGGGKEGNVGGSVTVNMNGGTVTGSLYGGGALANTNINNVTEGYGTDSETIPSTSTNTTTVNLLGGTIQGDAYGGGLGRIGVTATEGEKFTQEEIDAAQEGDPAYGKTTDDWKVQPVAGVEGVEALVYGDVNVNLGNSSSATAFIISHYSGEHADVVKSGRVFGCNNLNGSPKGTVLVKVNKTSRADGGAHAKTIDEDGNFTTYNYEVQAVYGGGNLAAYDPKDPFAEGQFTEYTYSASHNNTDKPVQVVIDGCDETSIEYVYGGGNAAPTPATDVTIIGSFEIGNVFGGGNGKDKYTLDGGMTWNDNNGADVGYKESSEYGSGEALASVYGGTVHSIFGGSNTKGNIRVSAESAIDKASDCPLNVTEAYGGGNEAYSEGDLKITLGCIDFLQEIYGGAKNADVGGDIELTITSGHFDRVFGGNNLGGTINGSITVNIEETGCNPITIGELYGCGNAAAYTTPDGKPDPTINIKSFTSIGRVFGGGLGEGAVVTGNPIVNINEVVGANASMTSSYAGSTRTLSDGTTVTLPNHIVGEIGAIGTVFGGGNAAAVNGNTNVNIGKESTITYVSVDESSEPIPVVGVDIRGNVYGGGNAADVTGSTNVVIGQ